MSEPVPSPHASNRPEQQPLVQVDDPARTLIEAREATMRAAEKGTTCPCCDQFVKLYRRKLNSSMARALILIHQHFVKKPDEPWVHVPDLLTRHKVPRADEAKLVLWGVLQGLRSERKDGSPRNGSYRITDLGRQFVKGEVRLPKYIWIYNQTVYGVSDGVSRPKETISILEALGERFSYSELMAA